MFRMRMDQAINGIYITENKIIEKVKSYEIGKIARTHHS